MLEFGSTEELLQHYEAVRHRICVEAPTRYVQKAQRTVKYVSGGGLFRSEDLEEHGEPPEPIVRDRCELGPLYFTTKNAINRIIARHEQANGLEPGSIISSSRHQKIVKARWAALCEVYGIYGRKISLPRYGSYFNRDHTTILHILRKRGLIPRGNSQKYALKHELSTGATKVPISPSKNVHFDVSYRLLM